MNRWLSGFAVVSASLSLGGPSAAAPARAPTCDEGDVTQISAGFRHACAVRADHSLWCWGFNFDGELGTGDHTYEYVPTQVTALGNTVRSVAASVQHTCAVTLDRSLWCWGDNTSGELGNGTTTNSLVPIEVAGLEHSVASVAVGSNTTCVIKNDHSLWCWGASYNGQLDAGGTGNVLTPAPIIGLEGTKIAAISLLTDQCALDEDGAVYCWGDNQNGALGQGDLVSRYTPTPVSALTAPIRTIAAHGEAPCALDIYGNVSCWGENNEGEVGDGSNIPTYPFAVPSPVALTTIPHTVDLAVGTIAACAIQRGGQLSCWGSNYSGELGVGDTTDRYSPTAVALPGATSVSIGEGFACATDDHRNLYCWGDNSLGQLGAGAGVTGSLVPLQVTMP
ncbi:MAG TPA: hypothetical protein VIA18_23430 [Polyangia bacterium]|jgi:alpha-tubulin suppressor-like RCC1 family protein|nr:hypothetical protein [Polyangia bacterium]HWE28504.1 hypothetical protein [Polyangia bacterium]